MVGDLQLKVAVGQRGIVSNPSRELPRCVYLPAFSARRVGAAAALLTWDARQISVGPRERNIGQQQAPSKRARARLLLDGVIARSPQRGLVRGALPFRGTERCKKQRPWCKHHASKNAQAGPSRFSCKNAPDLVCPRTALRRLWTYASVDFERPAEV